MYTAVLMKCHFIITLSDSDEIPVLCTTSNNLLPFLLLPFFFIYFYTCIVCFFNSICQVLYSLTEFWRYVVDDEDHLALFPNYSICSCSIRERHHINGKHLLGSLSTPSSKPTLHVAIFSRKNRFSHLSLSNNFQVIDQKVTQFPSLLSKSGIISTRAVNFQDLSTPIDMGEQRKSCGY